MSTPFGRPRSAANAYRTVGVETGVVTGSPHQLVSMLFDGFMDAIAQARGALKQGNVEVKGKAIGRAVRIIEEGLKAGLDVKAGGQLAADMRDLYDYVTLRLTQANLRNDEKLLEECQALIEPLRSAWASIGPQVAKVSS
ncbi:MAG: flagellar export chaperone FliS [Rhizobacter sp.]